MLPNPDEPPGAKKDLTQSRQDARTPSFYNFLGVFEPLRLLCPLGIAFDFLACL
jgi:hypothetical protein